MGSICVEGASVAGAKEKLGLLKPTHRTTQVSAVYGKHPELLFRDSLNPAGDMRGLSVGRYAEGVFECGHPSRPYSKLVDRTERDPGRFGSFDDGGHEKADDRNTDHRAGNDIDGQPELEQKISAGR